MTLPQVEALSRYWSIIPPPAIQLKRIALALGIPEPRVQTSTRTPQDALREAASAGFPVMEGRPDDPLLDFLEL